MPERSLHIIEKGTSSLQENMGWIGPKRWEMLHETAISKKLQKLVDEIGFPHSEAVRHLEKEIVMLAKMGITEELRTTVISYEGLYVAQAENQLENLGNESSENRALQEMAIAMTMAALYLRIGLHDPMADALDEALQYAYGLQQQAIRKGDSDKMERYVRIYATLSSFE